MSEAEVVELHELASLSDLGRLLRSGFSFRHLNCCSRRCLRPGVQIDFVENSEEFARLLPVAHVLLVVCRIERDDGLHASLAGDAYAVSKATGRQFRDQRDVQTFASDARYPVGDLDLVQATEEAVDAVDDPVDRRFEDGDDAVPDVFEHLNDAIPRASPVSCKYVLNERDQAVEHAGQGGDHGLDVGDRRAEGVGEQISHDLEQRLQRFEHCTDQRRDDTDQRPDGRRD